MHDSIRQHFARFLESVRKTGLADDRKESVESSLNRLPAMYAQFRATNDCRFGEEITRVVQAVLRVVEACPDGRKIDEEFRAGLHALHEEHGVPILRLKPLPALPKPKKARKA